MYLLLRNKLSPPDLGRSLECQGHAKVNLGHVTSSAYGMEISFIYRWYNMTYVVLNKIVPYFDPK